MLWEISNGLQVKKKPKCLRKGVQETVFEGSNRNVWMHKMMFSDPECNFKSLENYLQTCFSGGAYSRIFYSPFFHQDLLYMVTDNKRENCCMLVIGIIFTNLSENSDDKWRPSKFFSTPLDWCSTWTKMSKDKYLNKLIKIINDVRI